VQEETDKRREDAAEKLADVATKIEETAENQGGVAGSAGHAIAEGLNRASTAVEPKRSPLRKAVNSAISHPFVTLLLLAICIIIVRIMVSKKNDSVT
jgi:hypothetical protein